jgi:hypothetical protein
VKERVIEGTVSYVPDFLMAIYTGRCVGLFDPHFPLRNLICPFDLPSHCPLSSEEKTAQRVAGTFAWKPTPEYSQGLREARIWP